jgi:hypothetical protein
MNTSHIPETESESANRSASEFARRFVQGEYRAVREVYTGVMGKFSLFHPLKKCPKTSDSDLAAKLLAPSNSWTHR